MTNDGGIGRLKQRLAAIPKAVKEEAYAATLKQANIMADTMRRFAPDDPATGAPDLKTSIEVTPAGKRTPLYSQPGGSMTVKENAVAITVGNDAVRYPHLQEYGTTFHDPHPFFWPAVRLHQKGATKAIKAAMSRAIRRKGAKV